jgi:hypothetical protein
MFFRGRVENFGQMTSRTSRRETFQNRLVETLLSSLCRSGSRSYQSRNAHAAPGVAITLLYRHEFIKNKRETHDREERCADVLTRFFLEEINSLPYRLFVVVVGEGRTT